LAVQRQNYDFISTRISKYPAAFCVVCQTTAGCFCVVPIDQCSSTFFVTVRPLTLI